MWAHSAARVVIFPRTSGVSCPHLVFGRQHKRFYASITGICSSRICWEIPLLKPGDLVLVSLLIFDISINRSLVCIFTAMKLFVLLMGIYLLILGSLPCMDNEECNKELQTASTQHSNKDHENSTDNCTAFCPCNCCTPAGVEILPGLFNSCPGVSDPIRFFYPGEMAYSRDLCQVWQPPRVA